MIARRIAAAFVLLATVLATSAAMAGAGDYSCDDPSKVYYGNERLFRKPAEVDCDRVYGRISEYQEIIRRRLTDKDPEYHMLMKKASKRFTAAVKKMAVSKGHDLVAQQGTVVKADDKAKDVPDRTDEVIQALD